MMKSQFWNLLKVKYTINVVHIIQVLRYYTLCVADETDIAPVDSEIVTVAIIEEDDEHDETILA